MKEFMNIMMKDLQKDSFTMKEIVIAHVVLFLFIAALGFVGWLEGQIMGW